ncbi:Hypothetical predicted protein [Xyrichtys novacula]|uniref:Uncharacterized protein n=1 Tax=Xyrichtys novacula TaxID=13765 RepID=A0AAV1EMH9_XYRNO|nr:Hypothetical predicted protein [Xyrichtys novacula]
MLKSSLTLAAFLPHHQLDNVSSPTAQILKHDEQINVNFTDFVPGKSFLNFMILLRCQILDQRHSLILLCKTLKALKLFLDQHQRRTSPSLLKPPNPVCIFI